MSTWWTRERKSREVKLINRWENFAIFLVELFFHLHPPSNTGNCILTAFSIYKIKEKVNSKKPFIESPQKPHSRWLYLAACFRNINTPCLYPRDPPPVCQLNHFSHNYLQELGGGIHLPSSLSSAGGLSSATPVWTPVLGLQGLCSREIAIWFWLAGCCRVFGVTFWAKTLWTLGTSF